MASILQVVVRRGEGEAKRLPKWLTRAGRRRGEGRSGRREPARPRPGLTPRRAHGASPGAGPTRLRIREAVPEATAALPRGRGLRFQGSRSTPCLARVSCGMPEPELSISSGGSFPRRSLSSRCSPSARRHGRGAAARAPRHQASSSPRIRDARGTTRHAHAGLLRGQDGVSCVWVNHPPTRLEAHTSRLKAALRRELRA